MKSIKFYPEFVERILIGEKITTIRKSTDVVQGDLFYFQATDGDVFAIGKCKRVCFGMEIDKNGYSVDNEFRLPMPFYGFLRSEGFKSWRELVRFIDRQYGLPFLGVVIEFELIKGEIP